MSPVRGRKDIQKKLTDHSLPDDKREAKHRNSSTLDCRAEARGVNQDSKLKGAGARGEAAAGSGGESLPSPHREGGV